MSISGSTALVIMALSVNWTVVSADMCQDLCIGELGRAGCSKGSWCKNNHDCQSLFWTSALKTAICVFDGSAACSNKYPVLCHEAAARLRGVPATTTTTVKPIAATATTAPSAVATTTASLRESAGSAVEPVYLQLHYHSQTYDARPRVKVSFLGHAQDVGFSLIFDTGSDRSLILRASGTDEEVAALADAPPSYHLPEYERGREPVSRPAKWMEGYLDTDCRKATDDARTLSFGTNDLSIQIPIHSCITEDALVFSCENRFTYPIELDLCTKIDNKGIGIGLLGAGPTSHLAESAGVFAYIAPNGEYRGRPAMSAGFLIVGDRGSWDTYCADGTRVNYFPTLPGFSNVAWVVQGVVTAQGAGGFVEEATPFLIDTGADMSYVTPDIIEFITAQLLAQGAQLVEAATSQRYARYANCPALEVLPIVTFKIGEGPSSVNVPLLPKDYIFKGSSPGECTLALNSAAAGGARVVGINIISKLIAVFDRRNDRVGFCPKRT